MTLTAEEFLRRFLLHVLPRGFVRIRFFGFLAHRRRAHDLPSCRRELESRSVPDTLDTPRREDHAISIMAVCPQCGGIMVVIERLMAHQIYGRAVAEGIFLDSSKS
jgi:hypothetical protein